MIQFVSFFFFKQKTAYEMRISDWSSDVCSSDLGRRGEDRVGQQVLPIAGELAARHHQRRARPVGAGDQHARLLRQRRRVAELDGGGGEAGERAEERRGGEQWVSKCGFRWWLDN